MAVERTYKELTHLVTPGTYAVGKPPGLALRIREGKAGLLRQWIFRYMLHGQARIKGLGSFKTLSLAEARRQAETLRAKVRVLGTDPVAERHTARQAAKSAAADRKRKKTFKEVADTYIQTQAAGWKNPKHAQQWRNTLTTYAYPVIGSRKVDEITTADIEAVLKPIWVNKNETAMRLQTRIEAVFDAAKAQGLRSGDNPATMKGNLRELLPKISRKHRIVHHPALPYVDLPALYAQLVTQPGEAATALAFLILTAARTGEIIGATWGEIDLKSRRWTVPATRMKAKREHVIPLSRQATRLLRQLTRTSPYLFTNPSGKSLSNGALSAVLKRMGTTGVTVHGFRSTFRDWAGETTDHDRTVIEHALAHRLPDASEAAYARGTQLTKRQALMQDWADYCTSKATRRKPKSTGASRPASPPQRKVAT